MLKTLLISSLLTLHTSPDYNYVQPNLIKDNQYLVTQNNSGLKLTYIKLVKDNKRQDSYYLIGTIKNTSNISQEFTKIRYTLFIKYNGELHKFESMTYTDSGYLLPGKTSNFKSSRPFPNPEAIIIRSIESSSITIPINVCFDEDDTLCRQINP